MKTKKNILIINEYAGSPNYGMTFRHYYLSKEFINLGYTATIVTGSYSHFFKKLPYMQNNTFLNENIDGIDYLWIKVIKYSKSFDKKRVFKWFEFMLKLFFINKHLKNKPDYIIYSSSAPFSILPAYYLAKKNNAKLIFEVRDIWPLTLINVGKFSEKNLFIKVMSWFEKFALTKSDIIVSNLQNYSKHIKNLGIDRNAHWVSNGIDLSEMKNIEELDINVKNKIPKNKFIVGYTGKIGASNAINYLIEAAKKLKYNSNILFIIVGDGQEKENLMTQVKELKNILFIEPIDKLQIQSMLSLFDVCYIGWKEENIYQFGISPNKLFDYLYSAKPIIHSTNTSIDIVELSNSGISVKAENVMEITSAIQTMYNMDDEERIKLGKNGKDYVLKYFPYNILAKKYIAILNSNSID